VLSDLVGRPATWGATVGSLVYVQPVQVEVELDRHLHCGDELIVEQRAQARVGEWIVAESSAGACVGLYSADTELTLYTLAVPQQMFSMKRENVNIRGVVIGMRSAL
jgi:hypothetical protein